ncbi:ATP-binding protein [Ancylomarina sp. YFZ004]
MEKKKEILNAIGQVYDGVKYVKWYENDFGEINNDLLLLEKYFNISKIHSLFIAIIFVQNYKGFPAEIKHLAQILKCNPIKILEVSDVLNDLVDKSIIKSQSSRLNMKLAFVRSEYIINEKVTEAILNNCVLPDLDTNSKKTVLEIIETIILLGERRDEDELSSRELFRMINSIIDQNTRYPLIKSINHWNLKAPEIFMLFYITWDSLMGVEKTPLSTIVEIIFENKVRGVKFIQEVISEENNLIKKNLIELEISNFINDSYVSLSQAALKLLDDENIKIKSDIRKKDNVIEPEKIKQKELFYNKAEEQQIELFGSMLIDEKFKAFQNRLAEKKLPQGLSAIFYGFSGTGKTESVYQIAKSTNREIIKIDISQSKSMWFGESEKLIKKIFKDYKEYASQLELVPILLFNEADAILSKRSDSSISNTSNTENAIQNILLEELENFEGIFVATTNLIGNLDTAFERRFLFKIEFFKPESYQRKQIWYSKFKQLDKVNCGILSKSYDFSGGEIENISRKCEMHEIVHGDYPKMEQIVEFCNCERLSNNIHRNTIGF